MSSLGKPVFSKIDEFLENFRTAFNPFFGKYVAFFQKFMTEAVGKFSGNSSILFILRQASLSMIWLGIGRRREHVWMVKLGGTRVFSQGGVAGMCTWEVPLALSVEFWDLESER